MAIRGSVLSILVVCALWVLPIKATPTAQPLVLNGLSLTWTLNATTITFTLAGIPKNNWASVGWGSKDMKGLDMCTVHSGSVAEDRFSNGDVKPPKDAQQDCVWVSTIQQGTTTTTTIARALKTGDTIADKDIVAGPLWVSLSFGYYATVPVPGYDGLQEHRGRDAKAFWVTLFDTVPPLPPTQPVTCDSFVGQCPSTSVRLGNATVCPNRTCTATKCCVATCAAYTKCPATSNRRNAVVCRSSVPSSCTASLCCQPTCASYVSKCSATATVVNTTTACKGRSCTARECCRGVCSKYDKKCPTNYKNRTASAAAGDIVCASTSGVCKSSECCELIRGTCGNFNCTAQKKSPKGNAATVTCAKTACKVAECCVGNCAGFRCQLPKKLINSPSSVTCKALSCTAAECCI